MPQADQAQHKTESHMAATHRSKRFHPNMMTEKIVPILLILLLVVLLAVFVIIGLSLAGVLPSA
jgi:flagellar basal body-associated protein FliL